MTKQFTLWIVSPPDMIWSHVFDEVAVGLQSAFSDLGYDVRVVTNPKDIRGTAIVLGAHLAKAHGITLPPDCIIYNLEQVHPQSERFTPEFGYMDVIRTHPVWDYSETNIAVLAKMGVENVVHCAIGYAPELTRIYRTNEDIDVLFVGGGHPRRNRIFEEIVSRGVHFESVFRKFGRERDEMVARGKIHINLHKEPAGLFEIVRVSYLLANRCFVISETGADKEMEVLFKSGVEFCDYDKLVGRCMHYLVNPKERKRIADAGFELIRSMPQKAFLEKALEAHDRLHGDGKKTTAKQPAASPVAVSLPVAPPVAASAVMASQEKQRIFVAIASYRDPQCQSTVEDIFKQAAHPDRITVGICLQYDAEQEKDCDVNLPEREAQIRIDRCHWKISAGANWARVKALKLMSGEEYVLLIDSHMRFEQGWDDTLIDALARCPAEKPVLSAYCPNYDPPDNRAKEFGHLLRMRVRVVSAVNGLYLLSLAGVHVRMSNPDERLGLYPTPFCIVNCIFTRASTFKDVPVDPYIHFWSDEMNLAARLWTHGYDVFQLDRAVIYHYWIRKELMELHDYRVHESPDNQRSIRRTNHLLGLVQSTDPAVLKDIEQYRLGKVRSLDGLWKFAGINWEQKVVAQRSQEGFWDLNARRNALGSPMVDSHPPRIFVAIVSYRDADCEQTVKDLFAKAKYPQRISVGIAWQAVEGVDGECFTSPPAYPDQVRMVRLGAKTSRGEGWAQSDAQKLWQDEAFVLQISSSVRFEAQWDEILLTAWTKCGDPYAVLTCSLPEFTPPDQYKRNWIFGMTPESFDEEGMLKLTAKPAYETGLTYPSAPMSGMFANRQFFFGPSSVLEQVPADPYMEGESVDIVLAVRIWTAGYNLFYPHLLIVYQNNDGKEMGRYRADHPDWESRRTLSRLRAKHLLQIEPSDEDDATRELGRYGLGTVRSLAEYQHVSGVDFVKKEIGNQPDTSNDSPLVAERKSDIDISQYQISGNRVAGKRPKIFVNIASYRDPECQWTVKDLYEKARYPDRIFVGICWQFDEKEDKHCFEVVTRPNQVRVHPVDWREAEGVCWARYHTQLLWDGEDYTFMTDSHMRFVPGWDELMLDELARCPSDKPLLSSSPAQYEPPNKLGTMMLPTFRRVRPFLPSGNMRCQAEAFDRHPPHPMNGAFVVCNNIFSRSEITPEVPYDPYLYFDQEEITYSARLYTHGWDVFSASKQYLYHYYNIDGNSVRPLHWTDMSKEYNAHIKFLFARGLKRFNHLTGHEISDDPKVIIDVEKYGWGTARTFEQYEEYTGIDFKNKETSDKALKGLFIKDIEKYRDRPIFIPEQADNNSNKKANKKAEKKSKISTQGDPKMEEPKMEESKSETIKTEPVKTEIVKAEDPKTDVVKAEVVKTEDKQPDNEIIPAAASMKQQSGSPQQVGPSIRPEHIAGKIPKQALPVLLEPGDFMPFFYAYDTSRQYRGLEVYAGKYCIIVFLPPVSSGALSVFFREMGNRMPPHMVQTVWQLYVVNDTVENLIAYREKENIKPLLWADPDGNIARSVGVLREGVMVQPTGFILTSNLQIVHRHTNKGPMKLAEGLVTDCEIEQKKYRARNPEPKLITNARMAPVVLVENVFSPEFCKRCIDEFRNGYTFEGTVGSKAGNEYKPETKIRTDYIVTGALLEEIDYKFSRSFFPEIEKVFGFKVTHRELYKIGLYTGEKNGFFKPHRDNFDPALGYRRVASTIQLNDDYEGGGLRFPEYEDYIYRPSAGSGIAFSCHTQHEARPVIKGERFVVVAFLHGDEDEAYRRYYCVKQSTPVREDGYQPTLRDYPRLDLSRGFYRTWRDENLSINWEANNGMAQTMTPGQIKQQEAKANENMAIRTVGDHLCKKVFESRFGIVFDDFLPDDLYQRLNNFSKTVPYEEPEDARKVAEGWRVQSGAPLRGKTQFEYYTDTLRNTHEEARADLELFAEHVMAVMPAVQHVIGRPKEGWERMSVVPWLYPHGTSMALEAGKATPLTGNYMFALNPSWYMEWGGLLILDDGEQGMTRSIILRKNRMVFIAAGAYRMLTRLDEKSGDEKRRVLAGNFYKKEEAK